jgi:hypothetical protein
MSYLCHSMSYGPVTSVLQSIADAAVSKYFYNTKGFVHTVVIFVTFCTGELPVALHILLLTSYGPER